MSVVKTMENQGCDCQWHCKKSPWLLGMIVDCIVKAVYDVHIHHKSPRWLGTTHDCPHHVGKIEINSILLLR